MSMDWLNLTKWEAMWEGERVYIEIDDAGFTSCLLDGLNFGLLWKAKARIFVQYGNQMVVREKFRRFDEIDVSGTAKQPSGDEANFRIRVISKSGGFKCILTVNNIDVPVTVVD